MSRHEEIGELNENTLTKEYDMIKYNKYHEMIKNKMLWKSRGGKYCAKGHGGRFQY